MKFGFCSCLFFVFRNGISVFGFRLRKLLGVSVNLDFRLVFIYISGCEFMIVLIFVRIVFNWIMFK